MKVKLIIIGKTDQDYLKNGIAIYESRLKHYLDFTILEINLKNTKKVSIEVQKKAEEKLVFNNIEPSDFVFLLDEAGKEYNSIEFSKLIQKQMNGGVKNVTFVVGGPFGFSEVMYKRANANLSLSKMTFSHQMVRLFFVEQLYRAMTILKGEKYHHS